MKTVKILSVIIAALLITNVVSANSAVDDSLSVTKLTNEITILTEENVALRQEVALAGSLSKLQDQILALGFVENPKVVTLTSSSLALR